MLRTKKPTERPTTAREPEPVSLPLWLVRELEGRGVKTAEIEELDEPGAVSLVAEIRSRPRGLTCVGTTAAQGGSRRSGTLLEQRSRLERIAASECRSISAVVREAIEAYFAVRSRQPRRRRAARSLHVLRAAEFA